MERVGTLINKLKEQFEQHAEAEKMAFTAQLLLLELQKKHVPAQTAGKISVVLPASSGSYHAPELAADISEPTVKEPIPNNWIFDTSHEIPTLMHQAELPVNEPEKYTEQRKPAEIFDFNAILARESESLNEKLKEERMEVATALQEAPIRDLKKAIGLNDRFLFVNDLFRGDENMYERSLKTINAFNIYPEAEYWIQRELKVKLSWPDGSETVKLFDQLVKRRFASI
jgi:hypothetical protein